MAHGTAFMETSGPESHARSSERAQLGARLPIEDPSLARRLIAGEETALEEVMDRYGRDLKRLIGRLTAWSSETDDLLQETFVRAWQQSSSLRGTRSLRGWLWKIAINACRNHHRARARLLRRLQRVWRESNTATFHGIDDDPRWRQLQDAMQRLPPADRELLVLTYLEDNATAEVAQLLNITQEAFYVRLHRARSRLRDLVGQMEP